MRATTLRLATSMIEASLDGPFAMYTVLSSLDTSMPHGHSPRLDGSERRVGRGVDDDHFFPATGADEDVLPVGGRHPAHRPDVLSLARELNRGDHSVLHGASWRPPRTPSRRSRRTRTREGCRQKGNGS